MKIHSSKGNYTIGRTGKLILPIQSGVKRVEARVPMLRILFSEKNRMNFSANFKRILEAVPDGISVEPFVPPSGSASSAPIPLDFKKNLSGVFEKIKSEKFVLVVSVSGSGPKESLLMVLEAMRKALSDHEFLLMDSKSQAAEVKVKAGDYIKMLAEIKPAEPEENNAVETDSSVIEPEVDSDIRGADSGIRGQKRKEIETKEDDDWNILFEGNSGGPDDKEPEGLS